MQQPSENEWNEGKKEIWVVWKVILIVEVEIWID